MSKWEIEERLDKKNDMRMWLTKDRFKPFPEPIKKKAQSCSYQWS